MLSKSISKSIIKPITNLSLAINQIEKGNWAAEIDILSDDEIGLL
ncbi:HAMP domain-containing protein, partial [Clostridium neonatale]